MAQWGALQHLEAAQQEQVNQLYDVINFPMEVRHYLSHWIESIDWGLAAGNESTARSCFHQLLHQLEELQKGFVQANNILQKPNFTRIKSELQRCFQEYPLHMASIIFQCLTEERNILSAATQENGANSASPRLEAAQQMDDTIAQLRKQLQEVESVLKALEDKQEEVDFRMKSFQDQVEQLNGSAPPETLQIDQRSIQAEVDYLKATKQVAAQCIVNTLQLAETTVQALTTVELPQWRRRQQSACIGGPTDTSLDQLETWFTAVAELLQQLRRRLQNQPSCEEINVEEFSRATRLLLQKLLENALVVERQPCMSALPHRPLVVKTKTPFSVKLRFLAKLHEFRCVLKVQPVLQDSSVKGFRKFAFNVEAGKVQSKVLDLEPSSGGLVAEFGLLSLKEKHRRSTEGPVAVTEELHVIKFVTQLQKDGLLVDIESSSLPVVVVSSSNQVPTAWASILWYNMMDPEPQDLSLFLSPPPVPWQVLSEVLSWQFKSISRRGVGLNPQQLNAIRDKLTDDPDDIITWSRFCKNESVWLWLDGTLELIKKSDLLDLWDAGHIMGFLSKDTAEALLRNKANGTFLLRFSDSVRDGAVSFSWVERSPSGEATVRHVKPFTRKELALVSMSEEVSNYKFQGSTGLLSNPLLYLYPDTPKDQAFKSEALPPLEKDGYVSRTPCHMSFDPTPPPSPPQQDTTPHLSEDMMWTSSTDTLPDEEEFQGCLSGFGSGCDQGAVFML